MEYLKDITNWDIPYNELIKDEGIVVAIIEVYGDVTMIEEFLKKLYRE